MKFDVNDHKAFFDDLTEDGFHIFSRQHAKSPGFYCRELHNQSL